MTVNSIPHHDTRSALSVDFEGLQRATDCPHSMPELFQMVSDQWPDRVAIEDENGSLSYRELNLRARQLSTWLLDQGVQKEEVIGVCAEPTIDLVVAILAILNIGAVYLPLDPFYPRARLDFILQDAAPKIVLAQHGGTIVFNGKDLSVHPYLNSNNAPWHSAEIKSESCILHKNIVADSMAYIIYTSGSSGKPKGTMLTHGGLVNLALAQQKAFSILSGQRILQFASINFDASISEIFMSLCAGAILCMASKDALEAGVTLQATLEQRRINVVTLAPVVLPLLDQHSLPDLQTLIVAGEACSREFVQLWAMGRNMINAYGPTETTVCASTELCRIDETFPPPIGRPIANTYLYILDSEFNPVPCGSEGELFIAGIGLARGYLNRPDLTAEKFLPDPFSRDAGKRMYRTGDLVRYLDDGRIEFLGRIDDQVKIRGFRIELGEIESLLRQHESIKDALVLVRDEERGEKQLVAYVVPEKRQANGFTSWADMKNYLAESLPQYMIPHQSVVLERFPLTPNGKIDRKALPDLMWESLSQPYQEPADGLEKRLCEIWQEALLLRNIGIKDDVFELGAHSLTVARALIKINSSFGVSLSLSDLYRMPTIDLMAKAIRNQNNNGAKDDGCKTNECIKISQNLVSYGRVKDTAITYFLIPGAGGGSEIFHEIAEYLREEGGQIYIVQHDGVDNAELPSSNIIEMAKKYTEQILTIIHSPIVLTGFCVGGLLAIEIAKRLVKQNVEKIHLSFIDTTFPASSSNIVEFDEHHYRGLFFSVICNAYAADEKVYNEDYFANLSLDECIQHTLHSMSLEKSGEGAIGEQFLRTRYLAEKSHILAIKGYWQSIDGENLRDRLITSGVNTLPLLALVSDEIANEPESSLVPVEQVGFTCMQTVRFPGEHNFLMKHHQRSIATALSYYMDEWVGDKVV